MFSEAQAEAKSTDLQVVGVRIKRKMEKGYSPTPWSRVLLDRPIIA
jgi:hypothetical protein